MIALDRIATAALLLAAVALIALTAGRVAGFRPLVVRSGSMSPAIGTGDLVLSRAVAAADVRVGDVVSFPDALHPGIPTTHRVVLLHRVGRRLDVTTRGDANQVAERWSAPASGQIPRVALSVPAAGRVVAALGGRVVRLLLLATACTGLAFLALRRIWRT
jgi:signal peptidase